MQPVDASGLFSEIAQQGALFAFMMIVIIVLFFTLKALYLRNVALGDMMQKALIDSTVAISNSTAAVQNNTIAANAIARQVEMMNAK